MFYSLLIICTLSPCTLNHALLTEQSPNLFSSQESCYSLTERHALDHIHYDDITFPGGQRYIYSITCEPVGVPL